MTRVVLLAVLLLFTGTVLADKPRIIFDTDITGDVDDVLALAMCHSLADRGACEFLGVTISKNNPLTASFVDAENTFTGGPIFQSASRVIQKRRLAIASTSNSLKRRSIRTILIAMRMPWTRWTCFEVS